MTQPLNQLAGWREHKNRQMTAKITLFFESLAVLIIAIGIVLSILGILS